MGLWDAIDPETFVLFVFIFATLGIFTGQSASYGSNNFVWVLGGIPKAIFGVFDSFAATGALLPAVIVLLLAFYLMMTVIGGAFGDGFLAAAIFCLVIIMLGA